MNLKQLALIVNARRRLALTFLIGLVALVALYNVLQPRQYVATAAVMIDVRSPDPVLAGGAGANIGSNSAYMATQIDVIQSERVALRAIQELKLSDNPGWRTLWLETTGGKGGFEPWLAEQLVKKLDVKPSRESSVVNISYMATDPQFAAATANAFVHAYIDTSLDLKVEPARQYKTFFDESSRGLRTKLEDAQQKLSAYQQAKGIIATDDKLDVENARLQELSSQVVMLQGLAAESAGRQGQASANSQEVLANPMIGSITAELARKEASLSELRQRMGERNPQVMELAANIAQMRGRLDSETRRVTTSLGLNSKADSSRLGAAQAALAAQRAQVLRLRGKRDEASVLQRDLDNAQKAYDASLTRLTQTGLESQNTQTNISVLKTASAPALPATPRVWLNLAVALVVGTLLAMALAVAVESSDRRLRFTTDVTRVLAQPLLVSMPRGSAGPAARSHRLTARKARLVNALPQGSA